MNRNRFVLPLAALLMVPCFVGCSSDDVYQASFNNDQIICTHGMQVVDISLEGKTKNMLHFKDTLTEDMFEMPEEYKDKEIEYVASYNKGKSAFILFGKNKVVTLPEGETSITIDIKVKKNAFKEKALDSTLTVSLFANQIRYAGYSNETWGKTGEGSYTYDGTVEVIGALFEVDLLNEKIGIVNGESVAPNPGLIRIYKGSDLLSEDGHIELYCIEGNTYYIHLDIEAGVNIDDNVRIKFCYNSTSLKNYSCEFTPSGHDKQGPFLFVPVSGE